jgi:hypothetical protein
LKEQKAMVIHHMQRVEHQRPGRLLTALCTALLSLLALAVSAPRAQAQLTELYSWGNTQPDGSADLNSPVSSPPLFNPHDGYLYGCISFGGTGGSGYGGNGGIYKILPDGTGYQVLYQFQGGSDGSGPIGQLAIDSFGNIWLLEGLQ